MRKNKPEFHWKIIMSDEAHFYLEGYVNKQNCRSWGSENPKIIIGKPLYPQRVTQKLYSSRQRVTIWEPKFVLVAKKIMH